MGTPTDLLVVSPWMPTAEVVGFDETREIERTYDDSGKLIDSKPKDGSGEPSRSALTKAT